MRVLDVVDGQPILEPLLSEDFSGDIYLIEPQNGSYLGEAGVAFARVFIDNFQRPQVPGFLATDTQRDNRILPTKSWTSTCLSKGVRTS